MIALPRPAANHCARRCLPRVRPLRLDVTDTRLVEDEFAAGRQGLTIFEGTSEVQRLIIGRAVTGLDVR